ncbi:AzlC family ABC transporter permease [Streptomyces sp. NBC_01304]|uniref:AzlC family ABC transporter permease n=1 Tax=Streptomyces sp. NBC_01304 TaxID=2903818 RepID=UPI002E15F673|nr:AzlC family ABC transporter permease [Streptomyces sp. NBC_01304]
MAAAQTLTPLRPEAAEPAAGPGVTDWRAAASAAGPVMLGYLPVSFAFGVLAPTFGLPSWAAIAMSGVVFAGSSQFAALGPLQAGASPVSIVFTTFLINLRHALYSLTMAPKTRGWETHDKLGFAWQLTDEAFAVHSTEFSKRTRGAGECRKFNFLIHFAWAGSTALGTVAAGLIPDSKALGLDFSQTAMFIALLAVLIKGSRELVIAVLAGVLAVLMTAAGLPLWAVIVPTVVAATVGLRWENKSPVGNVRTESEIAEESTS